LDNEGQQNRKNNHGRNRKIKPEVFSLYPNVTGQMSDPVQLIMKKINDYSGDKNDRPCQHNIFSDLGIHGFCNFSIKFNTCAN
jgi:hypothetical protein